MVLAYSYYLGLGPEHVPPAQWAKLLECCLKGFDCLKWGPAPRSQSKHDDAGMVQSENRV